MITVHTKRGDLAWVDDVDGDLTKLHWYLNTNGYFMRSVGGQVTGEPAVPQITLHRAVMLRVGEPPSPRHYVDHINCDKRDNQRSNLRWCTPWQSNWNRPVQGSNAGYRGVYRLKRYASKYTASIGIHGRCHYLGIFNSAEDAARAYDAAARAIGGEYARLNLPEERRG